VGATGTSAVAAGMFTVEYSTDDGATFKHSLGGAGPVQSTEGFKSGDNSFGITGSTAFFNGVATSTDGGAIFTSHGNIWNSTSNMFARYGAFPTADTWYVSGGNWPHTNPTSDDDNDDMSAARRTYHDINQNLRVHSDSRMEYRRVPTTQKVDANATGWMAVLAKTTDGGKTFTTVFEEANTFYFNGIDCIDEMHCVVVGESNLESSVPGVRVYMTADGGKTWQRKLFMSGGHYSLMAARMISLTEAWVAGGELENGFNGMFLHTTDGGSTWTDYRLPGTYALSMSFPDAKHGFATVVLENEQCGFAFME